MEFMTQWTLSFKYATQHQTRFKCQISHGAIWNKVNVTTFKMTDTVQVSSQSITVNERLNLSRIGCSWEKIYTTHFKEYLEEAKNK